MLKLNAKIAGIVISFLIIAFLMQDLKCKNCLAGTDSPPQELKLYLVGTWDFEDIKDGKVIDKSDKHNDLVITGKPVFEEGVKGKCITLNGETDYCYIPNEKQNGLEVGDADFIIGLYYKPDEDSYKADNKRVQEIVTKGCPYTEDRLSGYEIVTRTDYGAQIYAKFGDGTINQQAGYKSSLAVDGKWHHVLVIKKGGLIQFYFDGAEQYRLQPGKHLSVSSPDAFVIGANYLHTFLFKGSIDEVFVYRFPSGIPSGLEGLISNLVQNRQK